jgi:hypothetical protein
MWSRVACNTRAMMWVSFGLSAAYAIAAALVFYPGPDLSPKGEWLLLAEGMFAGPMIIASALSILMRRLGARQAIAGFQVGYIVITLMLSYSTLTGEHDAQYQLALLFIPLVGFIGIAATGLITAFVR